MPTVEIHLRGAVVERVTPGGVFGELALIDGKPRAEEIARPSETDIVAKSIPSDMLN